MKILSYILSISVFLTSMPTISLAQPVIAPGAGEDPFYECRTDPTGETERQEQKVKFLEDATRLRDSEVSQKEQELAQLKVALEAAKQRVQNTSSGNRDTSVMDERDRLIEEVKTKEQELVGIRNTQTSYANQLKRSQDTLHLQKEAEKLTNSSIEVFTLTSGELDRQSIGGEIAETNLQLMALATSAVNHLECRASSDTESASYHIFKAAAATYMTNNLSEVMDYENLAECITKKALSPTEKKDVQYALIKRAKNLFDEMARHVTSVTDSRETDLELFMKAMEYSMKEWAGKNERVGVKHAAMETAKLNWDDAWRWQNGVKIAAIVASALLQIYLAAGLWAWWGAYLKPKENRLKRVFKQSENELRNAHQHTALSCNYRDAKRWNLANELTQFETYLAAKKRAKDAANAERNARIEEDKRLREEQNREERGKSEAKESTSTFILRPKKIISKTSWLDFLINSVTAQDQKLLEKTIDKLQKEYQKSTSTEPMAGSISTVGDSKSRIPPFTPGTPAGTRVVEALRLQYELKKRVFDAKNLEVTRMYDRLEVLMADYNDYAARFGAVAIKEPEIKCTNEYPYPQWRAYTRTLTPPYNWDNTSAGRAMAETWRTRGCTTANKLMLELKQRVMESYYDTISPQETILNALELSMDQAELDYLTAQQINEGADSSDPYADRLSPQSVQAAAYADFLGKIKSEWKTSSMNVEKDNFILVDRKTTWTLEKLLNEHATIKALEPNKKAGFGDAYTRYIYMQYAVDLVLKNLELLARAKSMALGQAMAYQELLSQADLKLALDAVALPTVSLAVARKPCMKSAGGRSSADPSCSCKAKGTCSSFSFPKPVLSGSSDPSSGLFEAYANDTMSGSEGARVSGNAMKRNAAVTKKSIAEVKSTIMDQRKSMGFQDTNIENMSNMLSSSINADARRSAATALSSKTPTGRGARILALEKKTEPEKVAQAFAAAAAPRRGQVGAKPQKKETLPMGILSIDESGSPTEGEMELETLDYGLETGKAETKAAQGPAVSAEQPAGVEYDPSKTLWKILTKRYQKSAFPRLLKKKKTE